MVLSKIGKGIYTYFKNKKEHKRELKEIERKKNEERKQREMEFWEYVKNGDKYNNIIAGYLGTISPEAVDIFSKYVAALKFKRLLVVTIGFALVVALLIGR